MPAQQKQINKITTFLTNLQPIPLTQKMFFVQYLAVMIKGGLSLTTALKTLIRQTKNKRFKSIILSIYDDIEKGKSLTQSFKKHPKVFSELFVNMIQAGELSGKLEEVLGQLYIQMHKEHDLKSKIKGALIYPIIVLSAMLVIGIITTIFIIPKLTEIFQELHTELPLMTRILIRLSEILSSYGIAVAIGIIVVVVIFLQTIKTKTGEHFFDTIIIKLPVIGTISKKLNLARFARTFSSLIKTDVPIIDTITTTASVLTNSLYKEHLLSSIEDVKKGLPLAQTLEKKPSLFPPVVTQMIAVGEKTGSLEQILDELANFYEEEISQTMKNLPSIIEPILLLLLGFGVGAMAVAVIMPMYSLAQQF